MKFLFVIFLLCLKSNSQITVVDSLSKKNIPFVEIYSEAGEILAKTNYNGEISPNLLDEINSLKVQQLYFNHNNYQAKKLSLQEFSKIDQVFLIPFQIDKVNKLDEVVVVKNKKYKYTKLTTYFRSIQFNNTLPQYYMDGIAEYYIDNKTGKIKINILKNRSCDNSRIKQIKESAVIGLSFNICGVPMINDYIDYEKIKKKYSLNDLPNEIIKVEKEGLEMGRIKTESHHTNLNINIYSESQPKKMKLLGVTSILHNYSVNSFYKESKAKNILKNILFFKEYRDYRIKRKKETNYTNINCVNEIYVLNSENTDELPPTEGRYYTFINKSNYDAIFLEHLKKNSITPLPVSVQSYIDEKLLELK